MHLNNKINNSCDETLKTQTKIFTKYFLQITFLVIDFK